MSYAESATLIRSDEFRDRVSFSVLAAAESILNETPDDTRPSREAKRVALATQMVGMCGISEVFVRLVAANQTIAPAGDATPDGDIDFVVASVWDAVAGVTWVDNNPPAPVAAPEA